MRIRIVFPLAAFAAFLPATGALAAPGGDFERAAQELRDADRNGDGVVSRAEFQQYRVGRWAKMDRNGDGYFSKDDLPALARSRWDSDRLTQLRRDFDKNRDGRISRAEFVGGPMPMFDAADSNRDNQVSKAELQALGQKAKAR
ncbi:MULTISPECIES: EF-hand domain-containing protein [Sphingopyxis]|uniref:EF-hand domain-containing protein n=1 Tax=Sphingopyxis TaxID=165697 RepID=UPI0002D14B18|nr:MULTISPECIES: EF-hand domain-containing protein [Sphingopyxis]ENY81572.1 hypothetical protein EBMC1_08616 [Sphingopyxis sp. MC1]MDX8358440.1 EF-hand domain-containing protein [Sphingopyxis terrae]